MTSPAPGAPGQYDVVIAGGGLAGATLALALAREAPGLRLAVVEPFRAAAPSEDQLKHYQPSFDARSTAMAWGTRQSYERLGVWDGIAPQATPITRIHVSEQRRFGSTRLEASDHDQPALGYVVDNAWAGLNLQAALEQEPTIDWLCPAQVETVRVEEGCARLTLSSGPDDPRQTLLASLLVVADGGRSALRESLGFQVEQQDYQQAAVIANVRTAKPHGFEAFERFTPRGPLALLPRGGAGRAEGRCALVWTVPRDQAEVLRNLPEREFLAQLQKAFGWRLGRFLEVGQRHGYPLTLQRVRHPVRPSVVLVGNAAHTLHPVAGQGFNLALRGLMRLARELGRGWEDGRSPGDLALLNRYWQSQQGDVETLVAATGSLVNLFSGDQPAPLERGRSAGLMAMDMLPPARRWFARQAMGLGRGNAVESVQ